MTFIQAASSALFVWMQLACISVAVEDKRDGDDDDDDGDDGDDDDDDHDDDASNYADTLLSGSHHKPAKELMHLSVIVTRTMRCWRPEGRDCVMSDV